MNFVKILDLLKKNYLLGIRKLSFVEIFLLNLIIFRNFYKDCPDGKLTLKQFEHEYSKIMGKPTQKTSDYVKHMFNVYDQDKNQFIDFK
jgi:hypothetical protein